jgi:hypothetical protein
LDPQSEPKTFEQVKKVTAHAAEYWSARDLQELLGYNYWRNFEKAISKAMASCEKSGNDPAHHFARAQTDRKRIPKGENLLDRVNTTELAANQFRMTQTREKLAQQGIKGQQTAIETHLRVGKEVRAAIERIGGTMPENLPPAEHIKQVEKRLKSSAPKLELDGSDAKGLVGGGEHLREQRQEP